MQPTIAHPDLPWLATAWEQFVTHARLLPELDPLIALSWQRCGPRLNPLGAPQWVYVSDEVLPLTLRQHAALRAIARPLMEDLHQFMEGAGAVILLLDSATCVLEGLGSPGMLDQVAALGMQQGAYLDEARIGTNAFGTALVEGCPIRVIGPEHFMRDLHNLCTSAAPIYDLEGRPVGVIGLIEAAERHSPQSLSVMVGAARAIENQLNADRFVREVNTHTSELNTVMDSISDGLLAWTAEGTVMHLNNQAGDLLGLVPSTVVGRPLGAHLALPDNLMEAVARGQDVNDLETSLSVDGSRRECLMSLRTVRDPDGEPVLHIATLRRAEQVRQLVNRLVGAQARLTLDDIVGYGPAARRLRRQALAVADATAPALLVGESGTGKGALARAIHNSGSRASGPFLAINCRAIPRALALGEFLGYESGGANGGSTGQPSKFELARGGTLFLDEVDALPLDTQSALLRMLEVGDVIRIGGRRVIPVDVRIVASTNGPLEPRVADGSFRADLLFRLSAWTIALLPLRERLEDIPFLIDQLLARLSVQLRRELTLSSAAQIILNVYPWPGNIRELETVLERAALLADPPPIQPEHLPEAVRQRRVVTPGKALTEPVRSLVEAERWAIVNAGRAAHGNLSQTAALLGIGRTTLWRKMKELGLAADDFQPSLTTHPRRVSQ